MRISCDLLSNGNSEIPTSQRASATGVHGLSVVASMNNRGARVRSSVCDPDGSNMTLHERLLFGVPLPRRSRTAVLSGRTNRAKYAFLASIWGESCIRIAYRSVQVWRVWFPCAREARARRAAHCYPITVNSCGFHLGAQITIALELSHSHFSA